MEPGPPALTAQSFSHWTTRAVPHSALKRKKILTPATTWMSLEDINEAKWNKPITKVNHCMNLFMRSQSNQFRQNIRCGPGDGEWEAQFGKMRKFWDDGGDGAQYGCTQCPWPIHLKLVKTGTSLVVWQIRICLPMQRRYVWPLIQEDSTCRGATKPVRHNYWSLWAWTCALQQEKPLQWSLSTAMKSSPCLLQLEKAHAQLLRPSTTKNNNKHF